MNFIYSEKSTFSLGVRPPPDLHFPARHSEAALVYVALTAREREFTEQTKRNNQNRLTQSGQNDDVFGGGMKMSVKQIDGNGKIRTQREHSRANSSEANLENVLPHCLIEKWKVI